MYNVRKLFETGYVSAVKSSKHNTEQGITKILHWLTDKLRLCMLNSVAALPLQVGSTDRMSS